MDKVNVLITHKMEEYLRQIEAVDQRLSLSYAADELITELRSARDRGEKEALQSEESKRLSVLLGEAEVLITMFAPLNLLSRTPKLKWLQMTSAGVDHLQGTGIFESEVLITKFSGVAAVALAELALTFMLMFTKKAPDLFIAKQRKEWARSRTRIRELRGQTVGVVGLGPIGRQIARLTRALGMRVLAARRSAGAREQGLAEAVYPAGALRDMLARSDFVVLALPLTAETQGLIGEGELRAMKPTAYLINIARGGLVDEPALIKALKEGWIAGAGLEVFATEPLPPESELWDLPNVILTPHIGGRFEEYNLRAAELICENLRRYLEGRELLNPVDKGKGY